MGTSVGSIIFIVIFFVVAAICAFMEKNVTLAYKSVGVYGKVTGTVAGTSFLAGLLAFVAGIIPPFRKLIDKDTPAVTMILCGIICLAIAALLFYFMYKKCPDDMKGKLPVSLIITALGTWIKISLFIIPLVMKMAGSSSSGEAGFAKSYSLGSSWYDTHSEHGNYAYLVGDGGNLIEVRPHGSEGLVIDDAGNIYYPNN